MTRAERLHNLLGRMLQVSGVVCVVVSFLVEYHSVRQLMLGLGGLLLLFIAAWMGRYMVEEQDDA